jgi:hypothetical protein
MVTTWRKDPRTLAPMELAGIVAVVLLVIIAIFQAALALGAPWGEAAWGGQNPGVLPRNLRIASGIAAIAVYPLIILLVLAGAGLIDDGWVPFDITIVMWILTVLLTIGAIQNAISRSPRERLWAPVALGVAICCALIAIG